MNDTVTFLVDSLFVYPIKACAGVRVAQLHFTERSTIQDDREWVVIDPTDEVTWQGAHPRLALVQPALHAGGLTLRAPGESMLVVPGPGADADRTIRLWNDSAKLMETHAGRDAGDGAAAFLERVTGAKLRLVRLDIEARTRPSINPVHVTSLHSLAELNEHLQAHGGAAAQMARLRPNLVLAGGGPQALAFLEEQVARLVWGAEAQQNELTLFDRCVRCVVPNVDPGTADVSEAPLQALAVLSAQRFPNQPVCFGVYGRPTRPSVLSQGDLLVAELSF